VANGVAVAVANEDGATRALPPRATRRPLPTSEKEGVVGVCLAATIAPVAGIVVGVEGIVGAAPTAVLVVVVVVVVTVEEEGAPTVPPISGEGTASPPSPLSRLLLN